MKKIIIYLLIDPNTNEIKYVGQSGVFVKRYVGHLTKFEFGNPKSEWIISLLLKRQMPEFLVIDEVPINEADFWELHYMHYYKSIGCDLLNCSEKPVQREFIPENYDIINKLKKILKPYKKFIPNDVNHELNIMIHINENFKNKQIDLAYFPAINSFLKEMCNKELNKL